MLEGGNEQLRGFFARHSLSTEGKEGDENLKKRYRTKAAQFYRNGIQKHVETVTETGLYRGRGASRRISKEWNQMAISASCQEAKTMKLWMMILAVAGQSMASLTGFISHSLNRIWPRASSFQPKQPPCYEYCCYYIPRRVPLNTEHRETLDHTTRSPNLKHRETLNPTNEIYLT